MIVLPPEVRGKSRGRDEVRISLCTVHVSNLISVCEVAVSSDIYPETYIAMLTEMKENMGTKRAGVRVVT